MVERRVRLTELAARNEMREHFIRREGRWLPKGHLIVLSSNIGSYRKHKLAYVDDDLCAMTKCGSLLKDAPQVAAWQPLLPGRPCDRCFRSEEVECPTCGCKLL